MLDVNACPLCNGIQFEFFESAPSTSQHMRVLKYLSCRSCGLVFLSPRLDETEMEAFYLHEFQVLQSGNKKPTEKAIAMQKLKLKHIGEAGLKGFRGQILQRYLDIGCSTGQLLSLMKKAGVRDVAGIEPGLGYREYVKEQGFDVFGSIDELLTHSSKKFDLVTMAHVLEHLPDPVGYLKMLREKVLEPSGKLLLEVPNLYGHYSFEIAHVFAFTEQTLRWTLEKAGFKALLVQHHSLPEKHRAEKHILVLAEPITEAKDSIAFSAPPLWRMKLERQFGLVHSAPLLQKPRAIAGLIKRELSS